MNYDDKDDLLNKLFMAVVVIAVVILEYVCITQL